MLTVAIRATAANHNLLALGLQDFNQLGHRFDHRRFGHMGKEGLPLFLAAQHPVTDLVGVKFG